MGFNQKFMIRNYWIIYLLILTGCVSISGGDISSKKQKKRLQESFLFKSAGLFYPKGMPSDANELPALTDKQVKTLEKQINIFFKAFAVRTETDSVLFAFLFERKMTKFAKVKLVVSDSKQALTRMDPDGYLTMDVKVAQAIFRGSLIEVLGSDNFGIKEDTSEMQTLAKFFKTKSSIDKAKGRGVVGDLLHNDLDGDDDDEIDWFDMTEITIQSQKVQAMYLVTFGFVFAHELGHGRLGHLARLDEIKSDTTCKLLRQSELEADLYGALSARILAAEFAAQLSIGFHGFAFWDLAESQVFLNQSYTMAGFSSAGAGCFHPDVQERVALLKRMDDKMIDADGADITAEALKVFIKTETQK
jgi:hypothetical protein